MSESLNHWLIQPDWFSQELNIITVFIFSPQMDSFTKEHVLVIVCILNVEITLSLKTIWAILQLSIYITKKLTSCHICSVTGRPIPSMFKLHPEAEAAAKMRKLHINSQACTSPLSAHSCSHLLFHIYISQAQASIVPHFLYMVFSRADAPARQRKMSLVH